MLLTVDIGNTNIFLGIFEGDDLLKDWRIRTVEGKTSDEYGIIIKKLLSEDSIDFNALNKAIIASVVPSLEDTLKTTVTKYFKITPLVVGPGIKTGIPLLTDNPKEVGADRIVNAVGAYGKHKKELIIIDFGTAITFDYVTKNGEYKGGLIAPGMGISTDALFQKTAKLPRVEVEKPKNIIGKNTVESLKSGIFYGYLSMIEGIISKISSETKSKPFVIATGGHAEIIKGESHVIDEVDPLLTLKGLKIIFELNERS